MFGVQWGQRSGRKSSHPMGDMTQATQLVRDLPLENANSALAEAAAWLESIHAEAFVPNHWLNLISMLDEAVHARVEELTLTYVGAIPGSPGLAADWRVLTDYLDRLGSAYCEIMEMCGQARNADLAPRLPMVVLRAMRAITRSMKVSWLRYLPPDRGSWESLVRCYRTARGANFTNVMASAYATDEQPSCPLHELTVGVMLAAAAPQGLTPRQVEIAYRIASAHRGGFTVTAGRNEEWRHYLFDLDNPGTPSRIPEQVGTADGLMYFSAEAVLPQLKAKVDASRGAVYALMPNIGYGREFGPGEKLVVVEHVLRFWDDNPPSRRDERRSINTRIHVEVGPQALRAALERAAADAAQTAVFIEGAESPAGEAQNDTRVAGLNVWTLTDFSGRGIGARFSRRLDRWLSVGSLVAFRLERSEKWCVTVVRRLRTDARNQTDVGCEILAKAASLVMLEGLAFSGTLLDLAGTGTVVHSTAVVLPEDAQLNARASLLFAPGTNAPGQSFAMHHGGITQQIRLGTVAENIDGWCRVEFDVVG